MLQLIYFLSALLVLFQTGLTGKIVEADDFDTLQVHLQGLNPQILVLWDVDETLITMSDQIMHPNAEQLRSELIQQYFRDISSEEHCMFMSQIISKSYYRLVDYRLVDLISELQLQGIPTIALTAIATGPLGVISSMEGASIS